MSGKLERVKWQMLNYIESDELKKQFNSLFEKVVQENENNLEAFIPIARFDVERANISNMEYIHDYEVLTGLFEDSSGETWSSEDVYKQSKDDEAERIFEQYTVAEDENDENKFNIVDENGEAIGEVFEDEDEAYERIKELKDEWLDENVEDLEFREDEVLWNTVYRFNNNVDKHIAEKVGLGVLEITNQDRDDFGDEYLFLQTVGMDMTPKFIAYQALSTGYIDEEYLSYFRSHMLDYTKSVIGGEELFKEVVRKLGIERFFQELFVVGFSGE